MSRAPAVCALVLCGATACSASSGGRGKVAGAPGDRPSRSGTTAGAASGAQRTLDTIGVDRVVVRWHAPETGGIAKPQFVFARELAFEARVEALADPDPDRAVYRDRHVRAALDRHIAETLLASLRITPEPTAQEMQTRTDRARAVLEQRVGGAGPLDDAARAEGLGDAEVTAMLARQARASLYLDRMVAPMLEPSTQELRALQETGQTPFTGMDLDDEKVRERMRRWYLGVRLAQALDTYYQNARSRVSMVTVKRP